MPLETATFINGLNASNPAATDQIADADNHLRLIKSALLSTFPNVAGAVNATHTELNTVADGNTAATATTLVNADQLVVNDNGTMKQVTLSDLLTYLTNNFTITNTMITGGAAFTAGMIVPFAGSTAPTGWLMCYGQDVSRTVYADLFTAISTSYGAGDGFASFTLPDLRGRVIAGQDNMGGVSANRLTGQTGGLNGDNIGATGGAETHTLTEAQLASHSHTGVVQQREDFNPTTGSTTQTPLGFGDTRGGARASASPLTINNTGSGQAHNNVQPTIILNYMIKT